MPLPEPPPGWGSDELTRFFDAARNNAYATFHNLRGEYRMLADIDDAYRKAIDSLLNTRDWFAAFFLLKAHSAFLAGVRLSIAGQVSESYPCLRVCLENSLYGLYIARNPASGEVWLHRHDDDAAKKKVRDEFKIRTLIETLKAIDGNKGRAAESLYDRTIDFGAHPNERALTQSLRMERTKTEVHFEVVYTTGNTPELRFSLRTCAQVGVSSLGIFELVYRERFAFVGLSDILARLRHGL